MLERTRRKKTTEVTFVLPPGHSAGEASVVGDFNDWQPGAHPLAPRKDGSRAVTVALPTAQRFSFRYLADGDHWFDEIDADGHDGRNSYLDS
ncbi:isoamylase early set domain-containing protein [Embleya sp. NBC_00896]|uniref:isoamylase early set domain-containing protein n=1 Tax=Embleya sp. NBC_00896 TaxID=2975961 RepID=UPI003867B275|nr:isoamylase early set domain-containing protein [Embleya sp. NBC_00896]